MKPRNSVIPIFYCVDPSTVRNQTGSYATAFSNHEKNYNEGQQMEKVNRWRYALSAVSNLSGWHLKDGGESKFIQNIIQDVARRLNDTPEELISNPNGASQDKSGLVGMVSRVENLMSNWDLHAHDVLMIGIMGMGGMGKTTIARLVYEKLFDKFDACCFLGNVRARSVRRSLVDLQKQLLSELTRTEMSVSGVRHGIWLLSKMFRYRKVLIVLDDADRLAQLEALAGEAQWFGIGSRIIITTRDESLLKCNGVKFVYMCEALSHDEATQLFSLRPLNKNTLQPDLRKSPTVL
ncbi:hypothetical protein FNV43_RR18688 [Rhamnella rubrinervis]|uniref:TIR domain-containing protein n=1 Tax=Rhamnella rubrinervis TaxID=2594499 RepID=A0A8K0E6R3_9ROSA|nr:hypothetical protein FNV43_RR18688 [Rhamnella rubrinervis]